MQRHVWHYLYNSSTGKTPTTRIDEQHIRVSLPNTLTGTTENYILAVDGRDQRTLLAFDGHLIAGSPRRNNAVIYATPFGTLKISKGQFYPPKKNEFAIPPYGREITVAGEMVTLEIYRYFLLLREGTFVFAGYDQKNLAPRYLISRIRRKERHGELVEWVDWLVGG